MLRFFRQIRQRLLNDNPPDQPSQAGKFGKYLLYATGEIFLVVIGILIALQIDNWNEERRIENSIRSHLAVLRQNLQEDQMQLRELRSTMASNMQDADSALLQMRTQAPLDKNLKKQLLILLLEHGFSPNKNAFETITQSNEIPFLAQDLQTAVLNYYALIERTNEREYISNTQLQSKYEPYIIEHYPELFQKDNSWEFIRNEYRDDPRPIVKITPDKFLADRTLETLLVSRYYQCVQLEQFYADLLNSSDIILGLIRETLADPENQKAYD